MPDRARLVMDDTRHRDVVGLGVSTLDIIALVDEFPARQGVQKARDMAIQGGGPVATAMVALARLGASVVMIDSLGDDWRGKIILEEFVREGVGTDLVRVHHGRISSAASILVKSDDGSRAIVYLPGNTPDLELSDLDRSAIRHARILHVNGRHRNACREAVEIARKAHATVSFDGGADRYQPEMRDLVPHTDICIVAREFAEKYTGQKDGKQAARLLSDSGPALVVITDGVSGSWIYPRDGKCFHQPAYLFPKTVDTTGCGDGYHGAFLFGMLRGLELENTAAHAASAAALNSQRLGGRAGLPSLEEVKSFLSERGSDPGIAG